MFVLLEIPHHHQQRPPPMSSTRGKPVYLNRHNFNPPTPVQRPLPPQIQNSMPNNQKDNKVYVGELGNDGDERELEAAFSYYGPLRSIWVARRPPGFAFVEFEDPRDAEDAVKALDGRNVCGHRVRVELSSGRSRWPNGRPPSHLLRRPAPRWVNKNGENDRGEWNRGEWNRGERDRSERDRSERDRSERGRDEKDRTERCFECNRHGHKTRDCPRRSRSRSRSSRSQSSRDRSRSRSRAKKSSDRDEKIDEEKRSKKSSSPPEDEKKRKDRRRSKSPRNLSTSRRSVSQERNSKHRIRRSRS